MADLVIGGAWQALDGNGDPLPGAKAYFYDTGTTNARTTYQDSGAVTPHADPVVADANGFFPEVFVTGGTAVKCVLKTSADVTVTTQDPCLRVNVSSSASSVSFTPTAEIAETNVQDAIENVRANLPTAGVSTYMKGLLDDADEATFKASVNLEIGTDVQAYDADLAAIAGLTRTRGDLIRGGDAAWERVALGTSGQVLTSDGTDAAWATPNSGLTFLSSVDLASDATADFTLTAGYDVYVFGLMNVTPGTDSSSLYLRTSTDGGSTFDSTVLDYQVQSLVANNATLTGARTAPGEFVVSSAVGNAAGEDGASGTVKVFGPHLAKQTHIHAEVSFMSSAGDVRFNIARGYRNSAADVDAIRFLFSAGTLASGTITLWGKKNA